MNATVKFTAAPSPEDVIHLSEYQIDEYLMGDLHDHAAAHLTSCEHCTQRVSRAAQPIAHFREAAMAWSERRSATMPIPAVPAQELVWQRRMGWAMASFVLVVGIAIGGAGRTLLNNSAPAAPVADISPTLSAASEGTVAYASTPERISADNHMLKAIDTELDASVESPETLGLEPVSDQQRPPANTVALED